MLTVGLLCTGQSTHSGGSYKPTVTITASDPDAAEAGPDTGKFTVTRTAQSLALPLVVYFETPGGTAQSEVDYQALPQYVQIPAGAYSADVTLTPILDLDSTEGDETVVLTLAANANYWVGWPSNATVTIADVPLDSDSDDLPDAWEWWHFGDLDQNASGENGDYDEDGASNLEEYNAGTDPNTIAFATEFADLYVTNRVLAGACVVQGGVPAQIAVLVNSTNLAGATWLTYQSNFTATLPDADGEHAVLVALRGRTSEFPPAWDETRITLDRVPPLLVITNPAAPTVTKPYLQLQGLADEPLATLVYDLTNAAGLLTNEAAFVVDQYFDTNRFDFTTNYFQAYDVELTNGLNTITLTVSDLAGNVTSTNVNVTLDYTSATNPPVLQVLWPTNGAHLSGESFYLRGLINDETARVTAQIVDGGVTNFRHEPV